MAVIIEELNHDLKVLTRHRFSGDMVLIGRGYQNDLILSDPHVCPAHIQIKCEDETWILHDMGSINGTCLPSRNKLEGEHKVQSGDVIHLGKSRLRVIFPDHPVAESITLNRYDGWIEFARHPAVITFSILLFLSMNVLLAYFNSGSKEVDASKLLVPTLGVLFAFSLWPLICSALSRFNKHEARVGDQIGTSFVIFNLFFIYQFFNVVILFNSSSNWPAEWLGTAVEIVLAFALFWMNLYIGFQHSSWRRGMIAAAITAFMFVSAYAVERNKQPDFSSIPKYDSTILAPSFRLSTGSSVEAFIQNGEVLFDEVEATSKEE